VRRCIGFVDKADVTYSHCAFAFFGDDRIVVTMMVTERKSGSDNESNGRLR
jgi:hypothetical protein